MLMTPPPLEVHATSVYTAVARLVYSHDVTPYAVQACEIYKHVQYV